MMTPKQIERFRLKLELEFSVHCAEKREDGNVWFDKYKFAELIIKKCIDIADNSSYGIDAVIEMKEYFGVE
jgi:hypothetical protein